MAPSSWVYDVFLSVNGQDVRKSLLTHFLKELDRKLIIAFKDNEIERRWPFEPKLVQAIRSSRIAVVVFSKNYASSSWCLNELSEIMNCKVEFGQMVIPVFYGLDPSHVRKQTGDFGKIFEETCNNVTEEVKTRWRRALTDVANILGYHSVIWDDEAIMIEDLVRDILDKLNLNPSNDFEEFVGIDDHIAEISLMLDLKSEEVRMVGIWGSSGIGKTTIARALYYRLNRHFQSSVFIDWHFISSSMKSHSRANTYDYNMKLHLQGCFLSALLGKKDIKVDHLDAVRERLKHHKVLIFIDDLDDRAVLDALVGGDEWFGPGSRIIVITKDKQFLRAHGINHIYEVCLPSEELALEMLCRSAFRQNYPPDGFRKLASEVVLGAGSLPLGLNVFGSYLLGKDKQQWIDIMPRLQNGLDGKIEQALRVSYASLFNKKDEALFRYIACLFNGEKVNDIMLLLAGSDLDVNIGLQNLVEKSLVQVREDTVEMHRLLQEMGKDIVRAQSDEPGEREFLVDSKDICDLLEDNTGTKKVLGISLDMDETDVLHIHENAFKGMRNLLFLKMYNTKKWDQKKEVRWHLREGFDYLPPKLRLLRLDGYPGKYMPSNFRPENLVKLQMLGSKLEKLWEGVHPLYGLKIMDLRGSRNLKEIPNLSMAFNLETLRLNNCSSLVELPSSIQCLDKLEELDMQFCENLQILPSGINLQSLNRLNLKGCSRLRRFPDISTNISRLILSESGIEEFPSTLRLENLIELFMEKMMSGKLWARVQPLTPLTTMLSPNLTRLWLSDIPSLVELPSSIQNFIKLEYLWITDCINLETLPTDINLKSLGWLDLSGCSRLKSFPSISTNISDLDLSETGIVEVPRWIENFSRLEWLRMVGCNCLLRVSLNISKLKHLDVVDFSDCRALTKASLNDSLAPDETSFSLPNNHIPMVKLNFIYCFNLDQKDLLEQQSVFLLLNLSGEEMPLYFTHRTTETSSLTIPLLQTTLSQKFFRFRGCIVVDFLSQPSFHQIQVYIDINCRFKDRLGNHFDSPYQLHSVLVSKKGSHLVIFDCCIPLNKDNAPPAELNYDHVDIQFHMSSGNSKSSGKSALKLKGCGIRLLEDGLPPVCESDKGNEVNLEGYETEYSKECRDNAVKMPSSRKWVYDVFPSFSEADVRVTFLSHLLKELDKKSIIAFKDDGIKRSRSLDPNLKHAIKDSRIAVVVFSKSYASSSWCLDELLEILKCKEESDQMLIPVFYGLDPSDVRKQTGDFGKVFKETCHKKTEEVKIRWREALTTVANIIGYHSVNWGNEATMIEEIANDVLDKLHFTPSKNLTPSMKQIEKSHDHDTYKSRLKELKEVGGETDGIFWDTKSNVNVKEADSFLGEVSFDAASSSHSTANKRVDPMKEENKHGQVSGSSSMVRYEGHMPQHQVFINFWGEDVRFSFISHLVSAFLKGGINICIGKYEKRREDLGKIFQSIEDSKIALVIFSSRYTESRWCLEELVKIKKRMDEGKLEIIPIFYKVEPSQVKQLEGDFGLKLWNMWRIHRDPRIIKWKGALESVAVAASMSSCLKEHSSESEFITFIVKKITRSPLIQIDHKKVKEITRSPLLDGENPSVLPYTRRGKTTKLFTGNGEKDGSFLNKCRLFGLEQRMKQLEQKLEFDCKETRIIGVVGMAGIGKTTLAKMLHEKWNSKFVRCAPLLGIRKMSENYRPPWLRKTLLEELLGGKFRVIDDKTAHESLKDKLLQTKVLVVLDDVSNKKQLKFLLGDLKWIKKGSKIVITSRDKSLIEGFVHDTYVVPPLNYGEVLQLFSYHAFGGQVSHPTVSSMKRCREFVDCAGGNPLVIKLLGKQFHGRDEADWEMRQGDLTHLGMVILKIFRLACDELSEKQRDVFLDIACFFRSEDDYFVRSLLDSGDHDATDAESEVRDLTQKGMIAISGRYVEMHGPLYMFGKIFSSQVFIKENGGKSRLWFTEEIIDALINQKDTKSTRGIFLDMSEVTKEMMIHRLTFINMLNLRYLKIYDSRCPRPCKTSCKLHFSDGLEFPLEKVRYLHWVRFPLEELPPDFKPEKLVDLRLPYSKIKGVWEGVKDTPRLKWVDLSHSSKLLNLSGLAKAERLLRLNLEGCTNLDELPWEMHNMKSLIFLNMRGCIRLRSLPKMNLISLKSLILSDCSNLEEFQVISKSLEALHLDGTAIKGLPLSIENLQRLVLFNMKDCKMLESLPNCLGQLRALEELILSGCLRLKNLPDVKESMKHVQILLLDGIGAKEMPNISCFTESKGHASVDMLLQPSWSFPRKWPCGVYGVSSLRRLCLSGNDFFSLQNDIGQLYNLTWLDVKQCKKLRSVPMLPPRLQYFDAHGCDSLEKVANPLAFLELTDQTHAIFNFSNCNKLDQEAQDSIISYTRRRSQLILGALSRHNEGFALEASIGTCFPGWEVPAWFSDRACGSFLEPKLPPHWCDNRVTGIALCAVIRFHGYQNQQKHLLVKCNCDFRFSCIVGDWSKPNNTTESSHVFIGYASTLAVSKHGGYDEKICFCTKSSLEFQVTDGTEKVVGCEVLQCGFSLVYATDETENILGDAKTLVIPKMVNSVPGEEMSYGNSRRNDDTQYQFYSGPTLRRDENLLSEGKSDATQNLQKTFESKKFDLFKNAGGEITINSYHHNTPSPNVEKPLVGVELRIKQLEKVLYSTPGETRIVGVIGMPGVGKTTLANILFENRGCKFPRNLFLTVSKEDIHEESKKMFLEELLEHITQNKSEEADGFVKNTLLQTKVFAVLDHVSDKKQLDFLLCNLNWIKKGSKIIVTACDKSFVEGLAHDTYVVPHLNHIEAFQVFSYHAFDGKICIPTETFLSLSRMFVENVGGNPLALKLLGSELRGKDKAYWEHKLLTMTQYSNKKIQDIWRFYTDELTLQQKDVLLDIACFFRSEDVYLIKSVLDSEDPDSTDVMSEVRDLAEKFLITISDDRVEMNDQLYTICKDLDSRVRVTLWQYKDILEKLRKMEKLEEANNVRGISLDMFEVMQSIAMERLTFINMRNLRYLKIYESCCPQKDKSDCKLQFPDGFDFPLEEVQYFHWLKFPLEELPPDFKPKNLVDLRLPYSDIERIWKGVKDTPRLKWVDLRHSSKLRNLSGLANAESLQRLNLEGCTNLEELPWEMQNMKSLIYLNMRGCIRLRSFPKMNLISLKTLILSDCSNLKEFQVISKSLEVLHLDGTSIKELPTAIQKLQRLVLLNLRNCKMLESLPNCLGKLKVLEELVLSGCSRLKNLPDVRHSMKHVQILLFDGTGVDAIPNISCFIGSEAQSSVDMSFQPFKSYCSPSEWPRGVNGVSSLRRLCLSGHDFVSLHNDIGQLYNLTWLDVKLCKNLTSVPMLPSRLQYFDAHGCDSLERVANPLALQILTEQIHATFNFSNCNKLDQDATDSIISYTRWKSQLILDSLSRYNGGFTMEASIKTCFPGWEVPAWFSDRAYGSLLETKLPPHWCDSRFTGIALCAVIQFTGYQNQRNRLSVKCNCELKNEDGSRIRFSCTVGGWSERRNAIESSHVFIGYASKLDIKKLRKDNEDGCIHTEASFEFQVTDGTKELEGCEVMKCGFSLLYASDELQVNSGEQGTTSETIQDIASSSWVQDFFGYIFLAFSCVIVLAILSSSVIVLAPQYYLSFSDFCWPLLARILFFVAFGLFLKHETRRKNQS